MHSKIQNQWLEIVDPQTVEPQPVDSQSVAQDLDPEMKAKYMKGDKADQFTGRIYFHGKPRFGHNDLFKKKVQPKLLKHPLRWNER